MEVEIHDIQSESEQMLRRQASAIELPDIPQELLEAGLKAFEAAYNDIGILTGGIAVEILNASGLPLILRRAIFFSQWPAGQMGSFGKYTPPGEVSNKTVPAFDINFLLGWTLPTPATLLSDVIFIKGGCYSMVIYQTNEFDLAIGVYYYYKTIGSHGPLALCSVKPKDYFVKRSNHDLFTDLSSQSTGHPQIISSPNNKILISSIMKQPGFIKYGLDVTLYVNPSP